MNARHYNGSGKMLASDNWRDALKRLQDARAELEQYGSMMTQYERMVIQRDLNARKEQAYQQISAGVVGEYWGAFKKYQDAGQGYQRAVKDEINRWDTGKLANELQTAQTLVNLALADNEGIPARLEGLYREAQQSGDAHKQRAVFEVLKSVMPKVSGQTRLEVNGVVNLAARDLDALRVTNDMLAAQDAQEQAFNEFSNTREELVRVGAFFEQDPTHPMAGGDVFTRAYKMVQRDANGKIIAVPEDHPSVTGVYVKGEPEQYKE